MNKHKEAGDDTLIENKNSVLINGGKRKSGTGFFIKLWQLSLAIIIFLILWEIAPRLGWVEKAYLPPFSDVIASLLNLIKSGVLFKHVGISLSRSLKGLGLAIAAGVPLGLFIGWNSNFERTVNPLLQVFRQTSPLALIPVFILFFGIGETTKVIIVFWGSLWPMLMNTIAGVENTPPLLIKMSRSMGESQFGLIKHVILPSASTYIFSGLKVSASISLVMLTAAEMVGSNSGIGYLILYSQQVFRISELYAALVTVAILGVLLNFAINKIEKLVLYWREEGLGNEA